MDRPRDDHTEQSKSQRERQIPYDITYMWNLKYNTSESISETETDSDIENRLVVATGGGGGGGKGWEFGISGCKPSHIEWMNNKVLLQHRELCYNEKDCICITESPCCTVEINTTL